MSRQRKPKDASQRVRDRLEMQIDQYIANMESINEALQKAIKNSCASMVQSYSISLGIQQDKMLQARKELAALDKAAAPKLGIPSAPPVWTS